MNQLNPDNAQVQITPQFVVFVLSKLLHNKSTRYVLYGGLPIAGQVLARRPATGAILTRKQTHQEPEPYTVGSSSTIPVLCFILLLMVQIHSV
ncbi:hypothetical protein P692DRAFT_20836488 [Suillus brevipes Sb2]|nr:hypothetical protein P692DRAFT_20836488 [Suillus brevipes Sb2]